MNTSMTMRTFINNIAGMAFMAILLLATSCSTDDGDINSGDKNPVLTPGSDARPSWSVKEGLYDESEQTMSVVLKLQSELVPFASADDLMCAVINDEVRAVSTARFRGDSIVYFPLIIASNTGGDPITVKYYNSKLTRIYTKSDWNRFNSDISPTVDGEYYVVKFF